MTQITLYTELNTIDDVNAAIQLMASMGCDKFDLPIAYAQRPPAWFRECRERTEGEDPLAAVIITYDLPTKKYSITSGNRCVSGEYITPNAMMGILFIIKQERNHSNNQNLKN